MWWPSDDRVLVQAWGEEALGDVTNGQRIRQIAGHTVPWTGWAVAVAAFALAWNVWAGREQRKDVAYQLDKSEALSVAQLAADVQANEIAVKTVKDEQERRRQYVESIPLLTQRVEQLVESQKQLTIEVSYNTSVMLEMLRAVGFKVPPRPEARR